MRLKEDSSSWKSGNIKRRNYRQAPLIPDEEVPRHKGLKRKPKHEHTYERRVIGTEIRRETYWNFDRTELLRREYEVPKVISVCTGCGNKKRGWHY